MLPRQQDNTDIHRLVTHTEELDAHHTFSCRFSKQSSRSSLSSEIGKFFGSFGSSELFSSFTTCQLGSQSQDPFQTFLVDLPSEFSFICFRVFPRFSKRMLRFWWSMFLHIYRVLRNLCVQNCAEKVADSPDLLNNKFQSCHEDGWGKVPNFGLLTFLPRL